jgi:hypothetical protein
LDAAFDADPKTDPSKAFQKGFIRGLVTSVLGAGLGGTIGKLLKKAGFLKELEKNTMKAVITLWHRNALSGAHADFVVSTYESEQKGPGKK